MHYIGGAGLLDPDFDMEAYAERCAFASKEKKAPTFTPFVPPVVEGEPGYVGLDAEEDEEADAKDDE